MRIDLARKVINAIFLTVFIILIGCTFLVYKKVQTISQANHQVSQTHKTIETVNQIFLYSLYIGRLEMEYFTFGDQDYLNKYNNLISVIRNDLQTARTMVNGNPDQLQRLNKMEIAVNNRISTTQQALNIYKTQGKDSAIHSLLSLRDKNYVFDIQNLNDQITAQEFSLLNMRHSTFFEIGQLNDYLITSTLLLSTIMLFICYIYIVGEERANSEFQLKSNLLLEEQNKKIQETSRLKSEFLANMSHELRTPLNGIIGFTELMYYDKVGQTSPEHKEFLKDILSSSNHLLQLINDILDLSKIDAGKMEFHPDNVSIDKLITEVCEVVQTLITKKHINLHVNIDPTINKVYLDAAKFKQVLYNYLSNSLKFTTDTGTIEISVTRYGQDNFRLAVKDNGIGIHKEDIPRLFAEFLQLDTTTKKKFQGTGLGLALTRKIVEAQGGRVYVESEYGHGSTFYAVYPFKNQIEKISERRINLHAINGADQPKILVIEDEEQDQLHLLRTLSAAGFNVEVAPNGKEAFDRLNSQHYDAITLDLLLPDTNGWKLLHKIRRESINKDTPVIIVTIVAEKSTALGFMVSDYITKPASSEELITSLRAAGVADKSDKTKILVIDDDRHASKMAAHILVENGFKVFCEPDGKKGLETAERERPDGIILDLQMPNVNGFEFLHLYRNTDYGKTTPVIIWTVKDLTDHDRAQLSEAAQVIIQKKNGTIHNLLTALNQYVSRT